MKNSTKTESSVVVKECQTCGATDLQPVIFIGNLPPVNKMVEIGRRLTEQLVYPAQLLFCNRCKLVQLGLRVDPEILFPPEYPYTSSTTKILRDNFSELYQECKAMFKIDSNDLIVDIGSNDGNLLSNFKDHHRVQGITPETIGKIAIERGIPTLISYFNASAVDKVLSEKGQAKIITATNVFAHMEDIHSAIENILKLLKKDGIFISESHYFLPLVETLQYDTIYHEHLRYYSLHSLNYLLSEHGFEVFHAKRIPTHGGSIRVYAARNGIFSKNDSVEKLLSVEKSILEYDKLIQFKEKVVQSKLKLMALFLNIKAKGSHIFGISAPSRASTLINYVGIDDGILDSVVEVKGSHKIGKYVPGTLIPIEEEAVLYKVQPDYALVLSWHIADELMPKIKKLGFLGDFIVPLPEPKIVRGNTL